MKSQRIHGMDFARAVLMTLGIIYHSALIYVPNPSWAMQSGQSASFFASLTTFTSSFRMHAFYVIAGFFFLLIIQKKGVNSAVKDRIVKLGIPLLFVGFTINFVANALAMNYSFPENPLMYVIKGEWMRHLWFIGNLIVYCYALSLVISIFKKISAYKLFTTAILIGVSPILIAVTKDQIWRFTGYDNFMFIYPRNLVIFLPYFLLGAFLYLHKEAALRLINIKNLILLSVLTILLMALRTKVDGLTGNFISEYYSMSASLTAITLLCLLGNKGSEKVREFTDASYTIYLIHSPIIMVLFYFFFTDSYLSLWLQYIILVTATFIICYLIHHLLIDKIPPLALLMNGKKTPTGQAKGLPE